jgi:hypothetical protein
VSLRSACPGLMCSCLYLRAGCDAHARGEIQIAHRLGPSCTVVQRPAFPTRRVIVVIGTAARCWLVARAVWLLPLALPSRVCSCVLALLRLCGGTDPGHCVRDNRGGAV